MKKKLKYVITSLLVFLAVFIFYLTLWVVNTYHNVSMDEIIFHLKVPLKGTSSVFVYNFLKLCLLPSLIFSSIISLILLISWKTKVFFHILIGVKEKKVQLSTFPIMNKLALFISIGLFVASSVFSNKTLEISDYIKSQIHQSTFIEDNYVAPKGVTLRFPEKKRNLIYIYLESMESTYMSKDEGGAFDENIIPELTNLAKKNISFSNGNLLGGALQSEGAGWTIAAMVAQTSGLPLKLPIQGNSMDKYSSFLSGVTNIGDILEGEGYHNVLMIGSDATFGGRRNYFQQHGDYEIWDHYTALKVGKIPQGYNVWWGYEDQKLFTFAKEKLKNLASQDSPFNFTLLTADTHPEGGYLCNLCDNNYSTQYANVLACSSRQVAEFVSWIQKQDFYENTTIVISGDHLTMDSSFSKSIDPKYKRVVYNAFINSSATTNNTKNRKFVTMDLFPTTLASLGVKIEGDRLALGTNLFSDKKTLAEINGIDKLNKELALKSLFYNNKFLYVPK